jgi:uncharacterized membrane protein (UPF0127 family)
MVETKMQRLVWAFLTLSLLLGFVLLTNKPRVCHEIYRNDVQIKAKGQTISAQTAKTEPEREKGLSGKACLGPNQGVLFVFDKPAGYAFWMKDMKFNIDIVWIGPDKKVVYEKENLSPATYPNSFTNPVPAKYVLEVAAGQAGKLGLRPGTQLYY